MVQRKKRRESRKEVISSILPGEIGHIISPNLPYENDVLIETLPSTAKHPLDGNPKTDKEQVDRFCSSLTLPHPSQ